jgi:hypothetical protein
MFFSTLTSKIETVFNWIFYVLFNLVVWTTFSAGSTGKAHRQTGLQGKGTKFLWLYGEFSAENTTGSRLHIWLGVLTSRCQCSLHLSSGNNTFAVWIVHIHLSIEITWFIKSRIYTRNCLTNKTDIQIYISGICKEEIIVFEVHNCTRKGKVLNGCW